MVYTSESAANMRINSQQIVTTRCGACCLEYCTRKVGLIKYAITGIIVNVGLNNIIKWITFDTFTEAQTLGLTKL